MRIDPYPVVSTWKLVVLWTALLLYIGARFCQLYADRLPALLIVVLHVVPPAILALIHGAILYRARDILVFAVFCLGIGGLSESISLRTGFPFGHYYFTGLMGPKVFNLPILLVLAYLGIGYCSWVISVLILQCRAKRVTGNRLVALPLLASFVMFAWDLSMEANWSTVDQAWIWQRGGPFFGVPISNFFGWFLTAYLFYQAFACYCKSRQVIPQPFSKGFWRIPVLLYGACALGNLLLLRLPIAPPVVTDPGGKPWITKDILEVSSLMSLLVMGPIALLAWLNSKQAYMAGD